MADDLKVVIEGTTYSLLERPPSNTKLVLDERANLLGQIDLTTLVQDLGQVGMCIRIAYNGVTAAGPKFTELQVKVQDLRYDVTNLCHKSAITVAKFKRACEAILGYMQATYRYLLDNFEGTALDTLASVSKLAGEMATAAQELGKKFDTEVLKVREVVAKTTLSRGDQANLVLRMKQEVIDLSQKQNGEKEEARKATQSVEEAEAIVRHYQMKEDDAIESFGEESDFLVTVVNAASINYLGTRLFGDDPDIMERKISMWKEKRLDALENCKQQQAMRREAYQKLDDFAEKIGKCTGEKAMADAAVGALHKAMDGLQVLAKLMMQAAFFWKQMQDYCKERGEDSIKQRIEKAMEMYDDVKRRKLWTSPSFIVEAARMYASWVALNDICREYMFAIQKTQLELYQYITENPTDEEAAANVKTLAENLKKELRKAQKAIAERESKTEEEIQSLQEMQS